MTTIEAPPIACTLTAGEYKDRLASIRALTRDALRRHERRGLVLDLYYALEAAERVSEMVRKEQVCCAFLTFDVRSATEEIRLSITAPESSRDAVDPLFEQFLAGAQAPSGCGCAAPSNTTPLIAEQRPGEKAAGLTAVTLATGAVACGACCVLPFALPAVAAAGTGSILAFVASAHVWVTGLAVLAVVGAWSWIVWQSMRARRWPAASTLYMMAVATVLLSVAVLWPLIEHQLARVLRA
ncbi:MULTISPECIES: hypothetical protein [unclassified Bradyrhizobium]|uniref:hypothetical protein n=1 Tax=unclassified Bradyrhizobium TaxID=2631580 RepID=UPI002FF17C58